MKKTSFVILVLCLFVVCGCSIKTNKDNLNINQNQNQEQNKQQIVSEVAEGANVDTKLCNSKIAGLQFSYPKNWGDCRVDENNIHFRTDFKKYNVDLVGEIIEITNPTEIEGGLLVGYDNEKISSNVEVFKIACGGALLCSGIKINNAVYRATWVVSSDQKAPENLDGIWMPEHNITQEQIWNILKSVK